MVGDDEESNVVASSMVAEDITTELLGKAVDPTIVGTVDPTIVSKPALEKEAELTRKLL